MKRKRRIIQLLLVFCLVMAAGTTVWAEKLNGNDDWKVEFTQEKAMVSNFTTSNFDDVLDFMQPGDSAEFSVTIHNSNDAVTDWYMANQVLKSLEDASKTASGGAYSYILTYTNPQGKAETLYNSETVGGENYAPNLQGLHEATDALDSFFYLDTLDKGKSGAVQLYVQLDGETQGNDYQDTLAQIQMNFAVELPTVTERHTTVNRVEERQMADRIVTRRDDDVYVDRTATQRSSSPASTLTRTVRRIVRTGDETNLTLLLVCAGILGLLLLILGILSVRLRKKLDKKTTGTMLLAVAILLSSVSDIQVQAADDYAYTVRIFSGAQGTFADGSTQIVMKAAPDTTLDFTRVIEGVTMLAGRDAAGNAVESKYYAKGIRESGKDNNAVGTLVGPVHRVTRDIDLVIAYAMKGGDVEYTVQYLKADTKEELLPSEHFYGNVGDKPVVAYKYIDGYVPQAYNLAKTLKEDAAQNIFTFLYTGNDNAGYYYYETDGGIRYVDKGGEIIVDHIPGMTIYREGQESSSQEQTDAAEPSYNVIVIPAEEETARDTARQDNNNDNDNGNGDNTANTDDNVVIPDAAAPLDIVDLDDEVTPLASGIGGLLGIDEEPGSRVLYMGTVITAAFLIGLIILMLYFCRRASAQSGGKAQAAEGRKGFRRRNKG